MSQVQTTNTNAIIILITFTQTSRQPQVKLPTPDDADQLWSVIMTDPGYYSMCIIHYVT